MSLDVLYASHVAQGEPYVPAPISVAGLFIALAAIPSSQLTGDDSTVLRAGYTDGRAKVYDVVRDFAGAEAVVMSSSGSQLFAAGYAQYFTLVAVQHKVSAAVTLLWVAGTVAVVADAAVPTMTEIQAALGDNPHFAICGDIRFHRSADTVIQAKTETTRRPAYTDESKKTGLTKDQSDVTNLQAEFAGYVDIPIDLTNAYTLGAGVLAQDGLALPPFPLGGYVAAWEYIPGTDGAGAGGDITARLGIDGTVEASSDLQILLAATALGAAPTRVALSTVLPFIQGEGLDVEVEAAATAFTAGSGTLRAELWKYV